MEGEKANVSGGENSGDNKKVGKDLECEYAQCFESWRFFLKLRSALALLSFIIVCTLLYFYFSVDKQGNALSYGSRFAIFVLGMLYTLAMMVVEGRNRQMYTACLNRAKAIELKDENGPGFPYERSLKEIWACTVDFFRRRVRTLEAKEHNLATLLISTPRHLLAWMTGGIYLLYIGMLLMWILLFCGSTLGSLVRLVFGSKSAGPTFF
ncbi:MAG: hypothetical protein ACYSR9_06645 [Planctomycetota bacterium]|jgi:hypothetical protein